MLCDTIKEIEPILKEQYKDINEKYIAEFKFDGARTIFNRGEFGGRARGTIYTKQIPELQSNLNCVLDGELIYENPAMDRYSRYLALMSRLRINNFFDIRIQSNLNPLIYVVFDILELNGMDLTNKPLIERKEILKALVFDNPRFRMIEYSTEIERTLFTAKEKGYEGIILKEISSLYENKRSKSWLKFRFLMEQDIEVIKFDTNIDNSITAETKSGVRVKVNFPEDKEVKRLIRENGSAKISVEFMDKSENKLMRFPVFIKIVEG
jgi:ATP-dependent DNA ligase